MQITPEELIEFLKKKYIPEEPQGEDEDTAWDEAANEDNLETIRDQLDTIENNLEVLKGGIMTIDERLKKEPEMHSLKYTLENLSNHIAQALAKDPEEIHAANIQLIAGMKELKGADNQNKVLQKQLEETRYKLQNVEGNHNKIKDCYDKLKGERDILQSEIDSLKHQLSEDKWLRQYCSRCVEPQMLKLFKCSVKGAAYYEPLCPVHDDAQIQIIESLLPR